MNKKYLGRKIEPWKNIENEANVDKFFMCEM